LLALLLVPALGVRAQAADPETVEVTRQPFGEALEIEGTFIPVDTFDVKIDVEAYRGPLEILEVVAEGPVAEGDVLVRFDAADLETEIQKSGFDLNLRTLALGARERAFGRLERETALTRIEVQRKFDRAREDLAYFLEVDKPMRLEES